jgi:hypothetical protein
MARSGILAVRPSPCRQPSLVSNTYNDMC